MPGPTEPPLEHGTCTASGAWARGAAPTYGRRPVSLCKTAEIGGGAKSEIIKEWGRRGFPQFNETPEELAMTGAAARKARGDS